MEARLVFDKMSHPDVVSWSIMIDELVKIHVVKSSDFWRVRNRRNISVLDL